MSLLKATLKNVPRNVDKKKVIRADADAYETGGKFFEVSWFFEVIEISVSLNAMPRQMRRKVLISCWGGANPYQNSLTCTPPY